MKTEIPRPFAAFWQAISEVPGWPDAPLGVRLRRIWPLLLPAIACLVLAIWIWGVREPHRAEIRAQHVDAVALEQEVMDLQQACSEQLAVETAQSASAAQARLLDDVGVVQARLDAIVGLARASGWKASAQVYRAAEDEGDDASPALVHVPARLRFEPRAGNPNTFNSLMALLRSVVNDEARFEITMLTIRADQPGVPVAEINLRASCRPSP